MNKLGWALWGAAFLPTFATLFVGTPEWLAILVRVPFIVGAVICLDYVRTQIEKRP